MTPKPLVDRIASEMREHNARTHPPDLHHAGTVTERPAVQWEDGERFQSDFEVQNH